MESGWLEICMLKTGLYVERVEVCYPQAERHPYNFSDIAILTPFNRHKDILKFEDSTSSKASCQCRLSIK